jgi:hypothetical protein
MTAHCNDLFYSRLLAAITRKKILLNYSSHLASKNVAITRDVVSVSTSRSRDNFEIYPKSRLGQLGQLLGLGLSS